MGWNSVHKYIPGDHWVICERCGFKYRKSEMRHEWTGLLVCAKKCWESRHPQDFVRAKPESQPDPEFVSPPNDASQIGTPGQITANANLKSTDDDYFFITRLENNADIILESEGFSEGDTKIITQYHLSAYRVRIYDDDSVPNLLVTFPRMVAKQAHFELSSGLWTLTKEVSV